MATKKRLAGVASRENWAEQIAAFEGKRLATQRRKAPITVQRVIQAALDLVREEGFVALTMRRIAAALDTGPASLYAHVRDKAELDDLLIGELCTRVSLPAPEPAKWMAQFKDVCVQLRELYLQYPGISQATLATMPRSVDTLRINEGMLAILLAGGIPVQRAAWAVDAALLYVCAYSLETSLRQRPGPNADNLPFTRAELIERLKMLPQSHFPNTVAHVCEVTSGEGHDRFDFTLELLLNGLASSPV
ncbi:TetR/AcrR family transcriptional regulator [Paraburkholderia oxyphila]|uniref:TetR/AcrR family transcriptional regulator n=1 Tax=Paraburkholderia oxyphila TaxID=614212 RepID=UPI000487893E|nr:TetR/AcrR family transcriptional regulator [Paraburkholderia oxyphila]